MKLHVLAFLPIALALSPAACSDKTPATPQAGINWEVIAGSNTSAQCPTGSAVVWNLGGPNLSPVKNGDTQNGAAVAVTCQVSGSDQAGYQVTGNVQLTGQGTFTIIGHFDGTRNDQPGIAGTFIAAGGLGSWKQTDCTVKFTTNDMGIAPGRVWAQIECPTAVDTSRGTTCEGIAEFRFENCSL